MRSARNGIGQTIAKMGLIIFFIGVVFASGALAQTATVTLNILNPPNLAGDIVVVKKDSVEVEFIVTDPLGELDKKDKIKLVRVDNGDKVSDKKRGSSLTGSVSLKAKEDGLTTLRVDYVHNNVVVASAPDLIQVVADQAALALMNQLAVLQVQVDGLDTLSTGQGTQIGVNTTDIGINATNIVTNTAKGATNMADIATNTAGIAGNTAGVTGNTTTIGANTGAITGLDTRVTTAETDIAALQATPLGTLPVDVAQNTADIATSAANIASNDVDIATLQGDALEGFTAGNTALGVNALVANTTGIRNVAVGSGALPNNTTGLKNTAVGTAALNRNTTGAANTGIGENALTLNVTGQELTAVGADALQQNTGNFNTGLGRSALGFNTTGSGNTGTGLKALRNNTTGSNNTATGTFALVNSTGSGNTALGARAGQNATTGSNNIFINNLGLATDSGTTRIGESGVQGSAFMAGIHNVTPAGATETVVIDADGQLGSVAGDVGTNATNIATNSTAIGNNSLTITGNTTAIGTNTTDISTLTGVVSGNLTDIGTLQTDMGKLQGGLGGFIPQWLASDTLTSSNMFQDGLGRIGIGTTAPGNKLTITDTSYPTSFTGLDSTVGIGNGIANGQFAKLTFGNANGNYGGIGLEVQGFGSRLHFGTSNNFSLGITNTAMTIDQNGLVGIGTIPGGFAQLQLNSTADRHRLWISGSAPSFLSSSIPMIRTEETDPVHNPTASFVIRSFYNGNEIFNVRHDGNAFFAGGIQALGGVVSSRTFKENISTLSLQEAKETLEHLDPITFTYKADANKDLQIGFIAEDVPELVSTPGRKGIQPMDIIAILTKVTQDQQKQIEMQQTQIDELTTQLTQQNEVLKARLSRLEAQSRAVPVSLH